jgi:sn-glycerol 3-phosphate transport system substrate-binding protein
MKKILGQRVRFKINSVVNTIRRSNHVRFLHLCSLFTSLFLMPQIVFAEPMEIVFWHSMAGHLGKQVSQLATSFNESQSAFKVKAVYKGDYNECLTSVAAAFRANQAPALIQIFEVGMPTMLTPKGIIKPVDDVMNKYHLPLDKEHFFPVLRNYYSVDGKLMAMPFNSSVPVMYYNQEALEKVGYDKKNFPKTWDEFEVLAGKLKQAGHQCVYATANPAWIFIESMSAIHGLPVINSKSVITSFNNSKLVQTLNRLRTWQDKHYFEYGGRTDDSSILFTSQRCPVYSQSSGAYNSYNKMVDFKLAVAPIPQDTNISKTRYSNTSGGAAIWIMEGHNDETYKGVAQFIDFLARPDNQLKWHLNTGYLPIGITGPYQDIVSKSNHPTLALAKQDLTDNYINKIDPISRVQNQIRVINEESLEAIFSGIKTPQQAMNDAVTRSNHALRRFNRNTSS